jgi:hypothetical protein
VGSRSAVFRVLQIPRFTLRNSVLNLRDCGCVCLFSLCHQAVEADLAAIGKRRAQINEELADFKKAGKCRVVRLGTCRSQLATSASIRRRSVLAFPFVVVCCLLISARCWHLDSTLTVLIALVCFACTEALARKKAAAAAEAGRLGKPLVAPSRLLCCRDAASFAIIIGLLACLHVCCVGLYAHLRSRPFCSST